MRLLGVGCILAFGTLSGCRSTAAPSTTTCVPEQQVACACPGGTTGTQVCAANEAAFSVCACADASAGSDATAPDAASTDAAPKDAAPKDARAGDGASVCKTQCDCPANTTCTIDGVCAGTACTAPCSSSSPCACGQACTAGFCGTPVGSLTPCEHDCDCVAASYEICVAGACILSCANLDNGPGCGADGGACAVCGKVCVPSSQACQTPGTCIYDTDCEAEGLAGTGCDVGMCRAPAGTPYVASLGGAPVPVAPPNTVSVSVPSGGDVTSVVVMMDLEEAPPGPPYSFSAILTAPDGTTTMLTLFPGGVTRRILIPEFGQDAGAPGNDLAAFAGHPRVGAWTMQVSSDPLGSSSPAITDFRLFIQ